MKNGRYMALYRARQARAGRRLDGATVLIPGYASGHVGQCTGLLVS